MATRLERGPCPQPPAVSPRTFSTGHARMHMASSERAADDLPLIDAHQHFWNPLENYHPWLCDEPPIDFRYGDYRALRKPYLPPDYRADHGGHRVVGSVYVETEWNPADPLGETCWVEGIAAAHGLPSAVVAQAWLDREDVAEVLTAQAARPLVRGIRHKPAAAARPQDVRPGAPGTMDDLRWRRGYQILGDLGLRFDLQTPWWHLYEAARLASDFPHTPLILNHTGLPSDRSEEGLAGWRRALAALAERPNTALKISGLGVPGQPWSVAANGPVVRDAIAIFGVSRCMFASNFPVDGLVVDFGTLFAGFKAIVADRPQAEQRALFHDNAVRWYGLAGA